MSSKLWFGSVVALVLSASPASAGLVNVDLNGPGGATHSGSDGPLSTGGLTWNGVPYNVDAPSLVDEFGAASGLSLVYIRTRTLSPFLDFAAMNNLQDDGMTGEGFELRGLDPSVKYTLAIYSSANAVFNLVDAAGNHGGRCSSTPPTYILPGTQGSDYCRFENLVPYQITLGVYGIRLSGLQGAVTGLQLLGTPPPDVTPPECSGNTAAGAPASVEIRVHDSGSGLASIQITQSNASGSVPSFTSGTRNDVVFTCTQTDPFQVARVTVTSRDVAGNSSSCSFDMPANIPPDVTAPTCSGEPFSGPPAGVTVRVQDVESGLASIVASQSDNAEVTVAGFDSGTQDEVVVDISQVDPYQAARVELRSTDVAGNIGTCVFEVPAGTPPPPLDTESPSCSSTLREGPPASLEVRIQDGQSGLASIEVTSATNATASIPSFASGTTEAVSVTVSKSDAYQSARIEIASTDVAGNRGACVFEIPADQPPPPVDTESPTCSGDVQNGRVEIHVQDLGSGLASITLVSGDNVTVTIPAVTSGTKDPVVFTASKADASLLARIEISSSDVAGNVSSCRFEIPAETAGPCDNPEGCCDETMGFYKNAARHGDLQGTGPGNSGVAHANIFERQLDRICQLIGEGDYTDACRELAVAIRRVDGQPAPDDFVTGAAATAMADRLRDLQTKLACPIQAPTRTTTRTSSATWSEPVSWGLLKSLYDSSK